MKKKEYMPDGTWRLTGWNNDEKFNVHFDNQSKTLTASVKIGVVLQDIHEVDPATSELVKLRDGSVKSVPYDSSANGANTSPANKPKNLKFFSREATKYNFSAKVQLIKSVLNQHAYKLILAGCSKGAQCGCRVAIKFDVAFVVVPESEWKSKKYNATVNLFPYAIRDDAENWGEVVADFDSELKTYIRSPEDYTAAHECGHLFNYPDEYYTQGGFVHEQYVKDQQLQFEKGRQLAGTETWQIHSQPNLMGSGARHKVGDGPKPGVPPYYMEYLRRWLTKHTNKKWLVGVNN